MKTINLFIKVLILSVIFSVIRISAQTGIEAIKRVSPDWKTDLTKYNVNLDELMGGGPPRDGIPAIISPNFVSIQKAKDWLKPQNPVVALEINGEAKAYPLEILIWHEIANDVVGGVPVAVTFCPLCYSAITFERKVKDEPTFFGVSGLLRNSDLVMYDHLTESLWQQFTGEAIVGEMTGTKLNIFPSQIISFKQFTESYPNGSVLSRETGFPREYGRNPYVGYDDINQTPFLFRGKKDGRLPPNEKVIGVKQEGHHKAYPYTLTKKAKVINDDINGLKVVVFHLDGATSALDKRNISESKISGSTGVFNRVLDGKELTFRFDDGQIVDNQTASHWNITGKAIGGKLKGKQLKNVLSGDYFSFAWFVFMPDSEIYEAE